jgi:hypothetical protein
MPEKETIERAREEAREGQVAVHQADGSWRFVIAYPWETD